MWGTPAVPAHKARASLLCVSHSGTPAPQLGSGMAGPDRGNAERQRERGKKIRKKNKIKIRLYNFYISQLGEIPEIFPRFSPECTDGVEPSPCRCQGVKFSAALRGTFENKLRLKEAPGGSRRCSRGGDSGGHPDPEPRPRWVRSPGGRPAPARDAPQLRGAASFGENLRG